MEKRRIPITVRNSRWEPDGEGGGKSVRLPDTEEMIEVAVDFEALARMLGPKAVHSKGGRAIEASGLVVVRHVRSGRKAAASPQEGRRP